MRVDFTEAANQDLLDIGDHIALDSPLRARDFIRLLRRQALRLKDTPRAFPLVPRYESKGIRRRVFRDYLIFYRVDPETVTIIHILHGARDYEALLDQVP